MDAGNLIDIAAVVVALGSAWKASVYAKRANDYSATSATEAQKATQAANKANELTEQANELNKSSVEIAQKTFALENASRFFQPIDTCTRLLNSLNTRETAFALSDQDCHENLKAISDLKAELKVLDGAAFSNLIAAESIRLEIELADELARYNQIILEYGFDLSGQLDTLVMQTNMGFESTIRTMTEHLPLLRVAFADVENEEAWNRVEIDQHMLKQALSEFGGDVERLAP